MIFGLTPFTLVHVVISLAGILSGFVILSGLLSGSPMKAWTAIFLTTTVATSLTGFMFPFHGFTPALGVGLLSMLVLAAAIVARYAFNLRGLWRAVYVTGAIIALYLNVFVLVVQSFLKIPALHALAPNGNEPPFAAVQGLVLLLFVTAGVLSLRRFHPMPATA